MKKRLLFIAVLACTFTSQAQVTFTPGIRAGANISTISNTDGSSKTGFYIGAVGSLKLAKFYTLQPEISYSSQGAKDISLYNYDDSYNGYIEKKDINLDYVSITLMNKFNFQQLFLQVGPSIDVLVSSSKYIANDIDIATNIGLGIDLTKNFTIEARFKMGMIGLIDDYYNSYENSNYYIYNNNRGRTFQIGGIFKF